jgi:membrane-bound lytic murein transglycosylase D
MDIIASMENRVISSVAEVAEQNFLIHTVGEKETLYAIAKKYEVTVDQIREWNALTGNNLKTGQQLRINKPADVKN